MSTPDQDTLDAHGKDSSRGDWEASVFATDVFAMK
jgi:hypothetical protein